MEAQQTLIVGPMIRKRRQELGLTQKELASRIGYKHGVFITSLEKGYPLPLSRWKEFAVALEIAPHELLRAVIEERYPDMLDFISFHQGPEST